MRIVFVSQYFPPEMGAPSARVYELSREWVAQGHSVTVVTGFPNHPTGVIPESYRGSYFRRENVDGIEVLRVPIYAAANKGFFRRVANYFSYSASASLLGPLITSRPDIVVATSPQILTAVAGLVIATVRRVPFVFDVRDLWPRSIVEVGAMRAGTAAVVLLEQLERLLYKSADRIVAVTDSFVDEIGAKGIAREKISVVTNGVDLELFAPGDRDLARRELQLSGPLVTYVGTHGMAHGLDTLLDAAKQLAATNIRFLLVGEGAEKASLLRRARDEKIRNVTFWDQRSRQEIAKILVASDLALVLLRDRPVFRTVIPSKIFEIMGTARAILTTVDGESRGIVERAGAGVFVPPEDPAQLAAAIRHAVNDPQRLDQMGRAGRRHVEDHYSRSVLAKRYLQVLTQLI